MKDIDFRIRPGIDGEMSLREVWKLMREEDIETLCITPRSRNSWVWFRSPISQTST